MFERIASAALIAAVLAACSDGEREAESKTPVASAEVQTTLPQAAVSDQALQQTADEAAAQASSPAPGTTSNLSSPPAAAQPK